MHWIVPSEKDTASTTLGKRLWDAAEQAVPAPISGLKSQEHSAPVLGLIFLRFAEVRFTAQRAKLESPSPLGGERAGVRGELPTPRVSRRGSRMDEPAAYHAEGILCPACGSGGMFVSSARFVAEHKQNSAAELSVHAVEKTDETGRLCRIVPVRKGLAVHGREGDIRHGGMINTALNFPPS